MPIVRRPEQDRQTLQEFYKEFIPKPEDTFSDIGTPMLKVLEFLNISFMNTKIYGLTSHAHLLLFNHDKSNEHYVVIVGYQSENYNEFAVEYVIPKDTAPWGNAVVRGETRQFEDFKKMIIISMVESGGWKDNLELGNLYKEIKEL
ncbi:hypothetical protein SAMN05443633_1089 [Chryseobacterium arachidis]|uniref:Uncharacterized protein n=3 Tax=Chryseobacterium arachidis TaxID=1416778 RepID=A0A1M5FGF2_9FLAO|nr:hypothetical protein [Chryseobacterium arachidis]SHF90509.1 hypothetical protein SAMN05443633_1089 [Chryseobacterium arachidis]